MAETPKAEPMLFGEKCMFALIIESTPYRVILDHKHVRDLPHMSSDEILFRRDNMGLRIYYDSLRCLANIFLAGQIQGVQDMGYALKKVL